MTRIDIRISEEEARNQHLRKGMPVQVDLDLDKKVRMEPEPSAPKVPEYEH